jgi:heme-degrading monooxygenase HmoA
MAVIETTIFRLADGVAEEAFLEADERVRTGFLYRQPGLLRATTARGEGGEWIVVVLWASQADTDAAAAAAGSDAASSDLAALVDGGSRERKRYTTFD